MSIIDDLDALDEILAQTNPPRPLPLPSPLTFWDAVRTGLSLPSWYRLPDAAVISDGLRWYRLDDEHGILIGHLDAYGEFVPTASMNRETLVATPLPKGARQ